MPGLPGQNGGSPFELVSMEKKRADKEGAQVGPAPSLPGPAPGLRTASPPDRRWAPHCSSWKEGDGALTVANQPPAQDVLTGDSRGSNDAKGQEEAGDDFILGSCWKLRKLVLCPPALLIVPKTEPGGGPDHSC